MAACPAFLLKPLLACRGLYGCGMACLGEAAGEALATAHISLAAGPRAALQALLAQLTKLGEEA